MQEDTDIRPQSAAENIAPTVTIEQGRYPLDAQFETVETKASHGHHTLTLRHRFQKPTLELVLKRDAQIKRETRVVGEGEQSIIFDDKAANVNYYDALIESVVAVDQAEKTRTFTAEEARKFPYERKVKAVQTLARLFIEVETNGEIDDFDFLLHSETEASEMRLRQSIGDETAPDFSFVHVLKEPTERQRMAYQASEVRSLAGSRKGGSRVIVNTRESIRLYDALFVRIEGAMVSGQPSEQTAEMILLKHINPLFKAEAVSVALSSFEQELGE